MLLPLLHSSITAAHLQSRSQSPLPCLVAQCGAADGSPDVAEVRRSPDGSALGFIPQRGRHRPPSAATASLGRAQCRGRVLVSIKRIHCSEDRFVERHELRVPAGGARGLTDNLRENICSCCNI
ncbi:hypothetical protein QQF64_014294 [Cirrhinus molitorella]|uniref:Uncharacterized protein n=1 Tax=Cirrhinus molitorella TaxID=172907 RepID=A0ABR3NRX2_9TELE